MPIDTNTLWNLFLAHWDEAQGLLFINTSDNSAGLTALAEALTGGEVEHVQSEDVFKPFHGLTRMTLLNVGLKHRSNRFTRFSMLVGPDVAEGMSPSSVSGKSKTNVFVTGRARGRQVTLGASTKGRIWSYAKARDMSEWVGWCQAIGQKIRDPAIKGDAVLEGAMVPTPIDRRPASVPLVVEWPNDILAKSEEAVLLDMGAGEQPLLNASLAPVANDIVEPLRFTLTLGSEARGFEVRFGPADKGVAFVQTGGSAVYIRSGNRRALLTEWFNENPPCIVFADLSELEGNWHFATRQKPTLMPLRDEDLLDWPWPPPVDITRESHRKHPPTPNFLSVQSQVFHEIAGAAWQVASGFSYDIIFDDDDAGEAADIVAIGMDLTDVRIDLFHCKFSSEPYAGARVGDLYEVCGQAARSVRWVGSPGKLLDHLLGREKAASKNGIQRFVLGNRRRLKQYCLLITTRRVSYRIFAVQPGLSKAKVGTERKVQDILASADTYLRQTAEFGLKVICSS